MGRGHLKKEGKKAESKAGQGVCLVVEKFFGFGCFEPIKAGTETKNRKLFLLRFSFVMKLF